MRKESCGGFTDAHQPYSYHMGQIRLAHCNASSCVSCSPQCNPIRLQIMMSHSNLRQPMRLHITKSTCEATHAHWVISNHTAELSHTVHASPFPPIERLWHKGYKTGLARKVESELPTETPLLLFQRVLVRYISGTIKKK